MLFRKKKKEKKVNHEQKYKDFLEKAGYKNIKIATLSKGKYQEFHDLDSIVQIGSTFINVNTRKIVGFVKNDTLNQRNNVSVPSRWMSIDPLAHEFYSWSPYNFCTDNPIMNIDPDGRESKSTHTDKNGKVLAVYNDGDLGVYKHENAKTKEDIAKTYSITSRSAGGKKMGETMFWDQFLYHKTSDVKNEFGVGTQVIFGTSWDNLLNNLKDQAKNMGLVEIAAKSANYGQFSIQDISGETGKARLFKGKYFGSEDMGNYLAGYNSANARQFGMSIDYDTFQKIAGELHQSTQNGNNLSFRQKVLLAVGGPFGYYYGNHPLYGEVVQQYRMSRMGWDDVRGEEKSLSERARSGYQMSNDQIKNHPIFRKLKKD